MNFQETPLRKSFVIHLDPKIDFRGYFVRIFCKEEFEKIGLEKEFVQINYASNKHKYTFRGFHYQVPPFSEIKLIRCVSGRVQDFIIDIRKDSPTFLKSFSIELSENIQQMLLVPDGFAHGYITLEENSALIYFHTAFYKSGYEGGLNYNDPALDIHMPAVPEFISERDLHWPSIKESRFRGLKIKDDK